MKISLSHRRHLPPTIMTSSLPSPDDSSSLASHFALPSHLLFASHYELNLHLEFLETHFSHTHLGTQMKKFISSLRAQSFPELHVSCRNINTHLATQTMKLTFSLRIQSHFNFHVAISTLVSIRNCVIEKRSTSSREVF